ncbi:MAG: response regulator transcription factor [Acidobacteria bacterium]|nr:response regulator transcription factor [Acidobacteriota bacterium]
MLRTLVVDDEPVARSILREELELHPSVEWIGEASDGGTALARIEELRPDLVFLDLQMPGMTGFDVMRALKGGDVLPVVVVVTAYDKHAVEALDAGAVDYLMKPVGEDRLGRAIERALSLRGKPSQVAANIAQAANVGAPVRSRKVVGRLHQEYFLLDLADILAFQAEGEIVWIVTAKNRYYATQPLRSIQEKLPEDQFQRVHRNAIVNLNHIRKMSVLTSQRWLVTLSNGMELIVSKRLAKNVRTVLDW